MSAGLLPSAAPTTADQNLPARHFSSTKSIDNERQYRWQSYRTSGINFTNIFPVNRQRTIIWNRIRNGDAHFGGNVCGSSIIYSASFYKNKIQLLTDKPVQSVFTPAVPPTTHDRMPATAAHKQKFL